MLEIGELRTDETEAAVALWQAAGLTRPWNDPRADIALALGSPSSTVLAGRIGGALAATAMTGHDGHRGWVYYLAVAPQHRSRGHARTMMRAAEDWVRAHGVRRMNLMVRSDNEGALGFYAAIGYRRGDMHVLQNDL